MQEALVIYPYMEQSVYEAMALDELLFGEARADRKAFIRLYSFDTPCITLGYFQKHGEDSGISIPWTRRITGGGVVQHDSDIILTFSGIPDLKKNPLQDLYRKIHSSLIPSLSEWVSELSLKKDAAASKPDRHSYCFQQPVLHDILAEETKIAGGALCLKKDIFLYQGALKLPWLKQSEKDRETLLSYFIRYYYADQKINLIKNQSVDHLQKNVKLLAEEKYNNPEWKRKE